MFPPFTLHTSDEAHTMGQHLLRKAPPTRGEHSQGISYNGVALSSPLHTTVPVLASSGYCLSWACSWSSISKELRCPQGLQQPKPPLRCLLSQSQQCSHLPIQSAACPTPPVTPPSSCPISTLSHPTCDTSICLSSWQLAIPPCLWHICPTLTS